MSQWFPTLDKILGTYGTVYRKVTGQYGQSKTDRKSTGPSLTVWDRELAEAAQDYRVFGRPKRNDTTFELPFGSANGFPKIGENTTIHLRRVINRDNESDGITRKLLLAGLVALLAFLWGGVSDE